MWVSTVQDLPTYYRIWLQMREIYSLPHLLFLFSLKDQLITANTPCSHLPLGHRLPKFFTYLRVYQSLFSWKTRKLSSCIYECKLDRSF